MEISTESTAARGDDQIDDCKEADETASHEQDAEPDADRLRLRQVTMAIGEADLGGHGRTFVGLFRHRHVGMRRNQPFGRKGRANGRLKALASHAGIRYDAA